MIERKVCDLLNYVFHLDLMHFILMGCKKKITKTDPQQREPFLPARASTFRNGACLFWKKTTTAKATTIKTATANTRKEKQKRRQAKVFAFIYTEFGVEPR